MNFGCGKLYIFKSGSILIDSHAGQSEDCTRPCVNKDCARIKTVGQHFINLSFYFTGTNL